MSQESVVVLERLNWDTECRLDMMTRRGFVIKDKTFTDKEKKVKSVHGIQSPLYGSDWEDERAFEDRYSCRCKKLMGKVFEGEVCKDCGDKVEYRDIDIAMTGWMIIKNHKIIQPAYYRILSSIIGDKGQFMDTITPEYEIDRDGHIVRKESDVSKDKNPFAGIGIIGLYERYHEVLDYYYKKKKNKREIIDQIYDERDKAFASCIPVYSSILRPISFMESEYSYTKIDSKFNSVRVKCNLLNNIDMNDEEESETYRFVHSQNILISLQKKIMELNKLTFSHIETKHGHIRDEIHGGRINYSGRSVIIPDPRLRADEVSMGYLTFLELCRFEIIGLVVKMMNVSYEQASDIWSAACTSFNPMIYKLMKFIIKKYKPTVAVNRNPTINYGSIITMKVIEVKPGTPDGDLTLSLPLSVLDDFNADFLIEVRCCSNIA